MSRGFVVGLLWGLVVATAGLAVLSLVVPRAAGPVAGLEAEAEQGSAADTSADGEADVAEAAAEDGAEAATETVAEVVTETASEIDADPAAGPTTDATADVATETTAKVAEATLEDPTPEAKPEVAPVADLALEDAPEPGVLALDLAPETAPDVAQIAQDAPQAPAPDNAPLPDQATMPAPKQDKLLDPPVAPDLPQTEPDPTLPDSESEAVRLPDAPAQPEVGTLPDSPEPSDNPPEELAEPETQVVVTKPEVGEPEIAEPQVAALETAIPEVGLSGEVGGVVTNRLPRIGDAPVTDSTARQDEIFQPEDSLPLAAYARPFESEAGKPRFAILLMDIGAAGMARDELSKLPFAVTFVIDPAAPDAAQAAQVYRAAGQEVVILATKMPEGATPADLEQSFQAMALILPETVAVLDAPRGGLQENRLLATQAIPILKAQGRAIVAYDRGLGAVNQVAERDGLAHALIFRDLDADGEDTPVIRRYLDRAAFKAAQEGQVLVIGQTRPETVAALLEWMVEGRAASVQLAPLTAVLEQN